MFHQCHGIVVYNLAAYVTIYVTLGPRYVHACDSLSYSLSKSTHILINTNYI